jgi:hypothetical protein
MFLGRGHERSPRAICRLGRIGASSALSAVSDQRRDGGSQDPQQADAAGRIVGLATRAFTHPGRTACQTVRLVALFLQQCGPHCRARFCSVLWRMLRCTSRKGTLSLDRPRSVVVILLCILQQYQTMAHKRSERNKCRSPAMERQSSGTQALSDAPACQPDINCLTDFRGMISCRGLPHCT